jgi:hypothetical protein
VCGICFLEFVYPIQHGSECYTWLAKRHYSSIIEHKLMIFGEKIELKVYVNQHDFVSDIQTPSRS